MENKDNLNFALSCEGKDLFTSLKDVDVCKCTNAATRRKDAAQAAGGICYVCCTENYLTKRGLTKILTRAPN